MTRPRRAEQVVILETDDCGVLRGVPPLRPRAKVEVTLRVLEGPAPPVVRRFSQRQGQFLAFIQRYSERYGMPPAEADMARHFMIYPESAHQMVVTLERKGLVARERGKPRTIRVLVPPSELPESE